MDDHNYDNAIFLCERLQAKDPCLYHIYLLAECYFRKGWPNRTYIVLQDFIKENQFAKADALINDVRYLYAKASVAMEKYQDGKRALLGTKFLSGDDEIKSLQQYDIPRGAAGLCLLAEIEKKMGNQSMARYFYALCVKTDGFNYTAWEELCRMNTTISAKEIFSVNHLFPTNSQNTSSIIPCHSAGFKAREVDLNITMFAKASSSRTTHNNYIVNPLTPLAVIQCDDRSTNSMNECSNSQVNGTRLTFRTDARCKISDSPKRRSLNDIPTPDPLDFNLSETSDGVPQSPFDFKPVTTSSVSTDSQHRVSAAPALKNSMNHQMLNQFKSYYPVKSSTKKSLTSSTLSCQEVIERTYNSKDNDENLRLSKRLSREGSRKRGRSLLAEALSKESLSPNSKRRAVKTVDRTTADKAKKDSNDPKDLEELSRIFITIGQAFAYQCQYKCKEAMELYNSLPHAQLNTGYVICQIARSWFEMTKYNRAILAFEKMQRVAPWRLEGLEYMSTALWHLRDEVKISHLALKLKEFDVNSPLTWMVAGNLHSLQNDHLSALHLFKRAVEIDKFNVYAYSLLSHERIVNEEYDRAERGYKQAIHIDSRHYNAWYGLGNLYQKQEKYDMAEFHYRQAAKIHPRNAVIYCSLGITYCSALKYNDALNVLERAEQMAPENSLIKFYKATIYDQLRDYESALVELKALAEICPKEATVHLLMGKIFKKLHRPKLAMLAFNEAININPQDKNKVKSMVDALDGECDIGDNDW